MTSTPSKGTNNHKKENQTMEIV